MSKARELAELGAVYDSGALSNRNLIINGAMQVFQRGTSFSGNSAYNADRWKVDNNSGGGGQSTDAPDGFTYSLKIDTSSGNAALRQAIELPAAGEGGVFRSGQKFTLSFYIKSDNAGEAINIFAASGTNVDATTTAQVNDTSTGLTTATSWTRYTYTFTSNNVGGSDTCYNIVPYVTTPSGAVYWTGFQLELGTEATPFEHRSFGDELARCQRYTYVVKGDDDDHTGYIGYSETTSTARFGVLYPVPMRAAPALTFSGTCRAQGGTSDSATFTSNLNIANANTSNTGATIRVTGTSGLGAADRGYNLQFKANGSSLTFDAEL